MIIYKKYDIGFVVENCDKNTLKLLEPWCSCIYIYNRRIILEYYREEQPNTLYDLTDRVKSTDVTPDNDIVVYFNASELNEHGAGFLQRMSEIISVSAEIGIMKYDIFRLEINSLSTYEDKLIVNTNIRR